MAEKFVRYEKSVGEKKKNGGKKSGLLWGCLGFLVVVVIGLVVVLAVVFTTNQGEGNSGGDNVAENGTEGESSSGGGAGSEEDEDLEKARQERIDELAGRSIPELFEENEYDSYSNLVDTITLARQNGSQFDDVVILYQGMIDEARKQGQYQTLQLMIMEYTNFLAWHEKCNDAMSYVDNVDTTGMTPEILDSFYSENKMLSSTCNDEVALEKWDRLYVENEDKMTEDGYGG